MSHDRAQTALLAMGVSRETLTLLGLFVKALERENRVQNLVSSVSLSGVWNRHILDSMQLVPLAPPNGEWLDLGSGAGFPGLIVATTWDGRVTLVEERKKRAEFLGSAANLLGVADRVRIIARDLDRVETQPFDVISARAFAPLDRLLDVAHRFATSATRWLLPKGRSAAAELEVAKASWQGDFSLVSSLTDPEAGIIIGERIERRALGGARG